MKKCTRCGADIAEDSIFCNYCGSRQTIMKKCTECGAYIAEDSIYCNHCGSRQNLNLNAWVDLGLPSGTLWKLDNESGYFTYDEAVQQFGDNLPSKAQLLELKTLCQWNWIGDGMKVTGPNGNSIVLPAAGIRLCLGNVNFVGSYGFFWSSTPDGSDEAWYLYFNSGDVYLNSLYRCFGRSARLVQD